jgi:hypothetical protein
MGCSRFGGAKASPGGRGQDDSDVALRIEETASLRCVDCPPSVREYWLA